MPSFVVPRFALVSFVLALGCVQERPAGTALQPIVDGTSAAGVEDDAVVVVLAGGLCSGTLIGPRLVMTAKHCVVPEGAPGPVPARNVRVGTGPNVMSLRAMAQVVEIVTTPGPLEISVGNPVLGATGTDVAFLVLDETLPGVEPIPVRREVATDLIGTTVTAIGYGTTRTGGTGTRLRVDATMTDLTSTLVEAVQVVCQGDSGGPLLHTLPDGSREVIGVTSFGVYAVGGSVGACPADRDYWNRVDLHVDLENQARLRAGECVVLGDEACNSLDDDCNGTVDEGCAAIGEACTVDGDCAFGPLPDDLARADAMTATCSAGICVLPCDRRSPRTSCASVHHPYGGTTELSGLLCTGVGCTGECRPTTGASPMAAFGATCAADADCASGVCAEGRCASACVGDTISCAIDEVCSAAAGDCGGCVAPSLRPTGRGRGEPCTSGADCTSGACNAERYCTLVCRNDRDCAPNMHCEEGECVLGAGSNSGEPCATDGDCITGRCGERGGARFCGPRCADDDPCVAGTTCVGGVCAPVGGVLGEACTSDDECDTGLCDDGLCGLACGVDAACPAATRCVRDGEASFCRRPSVSAGGCSASRGGDAPVGLGLTLGVLGLLLLRRHR